MNIIERGSEKMICEEFGRMLDNYENLTDEEKLEMTAHAASCEECQKELDFLLAIINQLNTLPKIQTPSDFGAKLNKRLDIEVSRAGSLRGILNSVKRNYRQYSTIAACLVLAVVIGANGKTLLDRMSPDSGGAPVTVTDRPSGASNTVADAVDNQAETDTNIPAPSHDRSVNIASANQTETSERAGKGSSVTSIKPIRNMSESINQIDLNSADKVSEPVYESVIPEFSGRSRNVDENAGIAARSLDGETDAEPENYTIARGIYILPDPEIARAELEASPD